MNNGRRLAAAFAAQYIQDTPNPSAEGYAALMALVANMRSEEYKAVQNLARYRDKDERSAGYHDMALEAFPHLQAADEELKRGIQLGEWEPEIVINSLRAAANATGGKAVPSKPRTRRARK